MCFGKGDAKQDDPGARKNQEIEKQLREDKKRQQNEVKILLLGRVPMAVAAGSTHTHTIIRCRGIWKEYHTETDAPDQLRRIRCKRAERMEASHIQQLGTSICRDFAGNGRALCVMRCQ